MGEGLPQPKEWQHPGVWVMLSGFTCWEPWPGCTGWHIGHGTGAPQEPRGVALALLHVLHSGDGNSVHWSHLGQPSVRPTHPAASAGPSGSWLHPDHPRCHLGPPQVTGTHLLLSKARSSPAWYRSFLVTRLKRNSLRLQKVTAGKVSLVAATSSSLVTWGYRK